MNITIVLAESQSNNSSFPKDIASNVIVNPEVININPIQSSELQIIFNFSEFLRFSVAVTGERDGDSMEEEEDKPFEHSSCCSWCFLNNVTSFLG
ncbi:unnamed protein product [[Candida] boidinii]|nr:unnamed protein product [[Candida] boidinii]